MHKHRVGEEAVLWRIRFNIAYANWKRIIDRNHPGFADEDSYEQMERNVEDGWVDLDAISDPNFKCCGP